MKKKTKSLFNALLISAFIFVFGPAQSNQVLKIGNEGAKITVKVFSSLTCPHCASFHNKVFNSLKTEYIDTQKIKFEHHSFPLDLAALNAEKVLRSVEDKEKSFQFLSVIYKKQSQWAVGSDINTINESIKKIGLEFGLDAKIIDEFLKSDKIQDQILNERINAQKNYNITSTPTIYINEKKYEGEHEFKSFKKELDKKL
jgi:protein-disulfide isomerase